MVRFVQRPRGSPAHFKRVGRYAVFDENVAMGSLAGPLSPQRLSALVTGWVTAAGGAWNASMVSEYINYKEKRSWPMGSEQLLPKPLTKLTFICWLRV